tara:strand:- start:161 stop:442 length:282 start_codon:yes stop_codon:yes gene_type:complete
MEKYYAFRDLDKAGSYEEIAEYCAYGIVESFHEKIEKPSFSEKDMVVNYFNPFTGNFDRCWRGFKKVELFEIEKHEHEHLLERYGKLDEVSWV